MITVHKSQGMYHIFTTSKDIEVIHPNVEMMAIISDRVIYRTKSKDVFDSVVRLTRQFEHQQKEKMLDEMSKAYWRF